MKGIQWKFVVSFIVILFYTQTVYSQLSLIVTSVPTTTPAEDHIFVVGSFNDWNPADSVYKLTRRPDGTHYIRLPFRGDFDYKFTRGSWKKVEGSYNGEAIDNREFRMDDSHSDTLKLLS